MSGVIGAAFNAGVERAAQLAQYEKTNAIEEVKLQTRVTSEVNDLVRELSGSNEAMRKAMESKKAVTDADHPIQQFIGWAQENLDNKFLGQHSMKVAYATYMASTGGLDKAMANVAKTTRERMIQQMEKAQETVRTVGRDAQRPSAANVNVAGIDTARYQADPAYAMSVYESARQKGDFAQMRKLETFANTGRWPD